MSQNSIESCTRLSNTTDTLTIDASSVVFTKLPTTMDNTPTDANQLVTKSYMDSTIATKQDTITDTTVLTTGTIDISGNLTVSGNVTAPVIIQDGINLFDALVGKQDKLSAGNGITLTSDTPTPGITSITTRPSYFYASLSTSYPPGDSTQYVLKYNTVQYDTSEFSYDSSTGVLTVTNAGAYEISASANMDVTNLTDRVTLRARLRINSGWEQGDPQSYAYMRHYGYGMYGTATISPTIKILSARDTIDISCNVNKANTRAFGSNFIGLDFFHGCNILVKRLH
jgi:phage baseplate assembly protein gpV